MGLFCSAEGGGTGAGARTGETTLGVRDGWGRDSPDGGVHLAFVLLVVVQLGEEREEHLDAPDGVDGTVDGVGHDGLHILHEERGMERERGTERERERGNQRESVCVCVCVWL